MTDVQQADSSAVEEMPPPESSAADQVPNESNASGVPLPDPIHEPEDKWTCIKCGSVNSPVIVSGSFATDDVVMGPAPTCWNCGDQRHEKLEELGVTNKTVQALAGGLVDQAQNAAGVEALERPAGETATSAAKPEQPALKFPAGQFDADAAFLAIERQNRIVKAAKSEWEDLKEQTSEARKTYDKATDTLSQLIEFHEDKKHEGERQPFLREVDQETATCEVSKMMGAPCPACASQRAKGEPADPNDPLHPAHPQHEAIAKSLLVKDAMDLATRLQGKHFYMDAAALMLLPIGELQTLQRYSVQTGAIPPEMLTRAHVAAAAGTERQECKHCSTVLIDAKRVDLGASFYPENAAVGLDCERSQPTAEEASRSPKSHATKNRKKKAEPEVERQAQASEGKKKAAKESAPKKARKARK